jgi:hypothetical protein
MVKANLKEELSALYTLNYLSETKQERGDCVGV